MKYRFLMGGSKFCDLILRVRRQLQSFLVSSNSFNISRKNKMCKDFFFKPEIHENSHSLEFIALSNVQAIQKEFTFACLVTMSMKEEDGTRSFLIFLLTILYWMISLLMSSMLCSIYKYIDNTFMYLLTT